MSPALKCHCECLFQVYDYFEDSRYVYLVLELCHNGEFQHYLNSQGGVLTEAEAQKVMRQVVEGVQYLQKHQILHRDLTLSNLLLTRDMKTVSNIWWLLHNLCSLMKVKVTYLPSLAPH